jgi:hypothetical protein
MNIVFLHFHTGSYQCTAIIVGLSNRLWTNTESKNLPFFIPQLKASILKELDAIPLTNFGHN